MSDHAEADDIVSEVFTTAWRRRHDLRPDDSPLPWLYGIAANTIRNSRRSQHRRLRLVDRLETEPQPNPLDDPADRDDSDLFAALDRLSFEDRELLTLIAWEGLTHAEAGVVFDCSTNAIGIRLHRARQRLRAELENQTGRTPPTERPDRTEGDE